MDQIELYMDGQPLRDNQRLSQRGINEGALVYFAIAKKTQPKPKTGMGLADMIRGFDKKVKGIS